MHLGLSFFQAQLGQVRLKTGGGIEYGVHGAKIMQSSLTFRRDSVNLLLFFMISSLTLPPPKKDQWWTSAPQKRLTAFTALLDKQKFGVNERCTLEHYCSSVKAAAPSVWPPCLPMVPVAPQRGRLTWAEQKGFCGAAKQCRLNAKFYVDIDVPFPFLQVFDNWSQHIGNFSPNHHFHVINLKCKTFERGTFTLKHIDPIIHFGVAFWPLGPRAVCLDLGPPIWSPTRCPCVSGHCAKTSPV